MAKKTKLSAMVLTGRLNRMLEKFRAGDKDPELRDTIARLAVDMALVDVEIDEKLAAATLEHAGPDVVDAGVQDPAWRAIVRTAKGLKKK